MGKSTSKLYERKWRSAYDENRFNYITDRRQLTQQEKCDFLFSIRDGQEENVIKQIKDNPHLLSCMFWFEYYVLETATKKEFCACSQNLELCYKEGIPTGEMIKRLELAIITTRCPHVALNKTRKVITVDQDISSAEVSNTCDVTVPQNVCRYTRKITAGVYWIHLAVIYDKQEIIKQVLPFASTCGVFDDYLNTSKHHFTPVHIALTHSNPQMGIAIATVDPQLLYTTPCNVDTEYNYLNDPLSVALQFNHLNTFCKLYNIMKLYEKRRLDCRLFRANNIMQFWSERTIELLEKNNMKEASILLSIDKLELVFYKRIFQLIYEKGIYWMCDIILAESDFSQQMINGTKDDKSMFDEVMIKAVFSDEAHAVQLFIDNGLDKNAEFKECSVLTWAEYLEFNDVVRVLRSAQAFRKVHNYSYSMLYLIVDYKHDNGDIMIDNLPIIHRIFQVRKHQYNNTLCVMDTLALAWRNYQHGEFQYLLLQGADPIHIVNTMGRLGHHHRTNSLIYHFISANIFVDSQKLFPLFRQHDITALSILDELALSPLTSSLMDTAQRYSKDFTKFVELWTEWYEPVRPLSILCRRSLRKHFTGYQYYLFLDLKSDILPLPIMKFLGMTDLLMPVSLTLDGYNDIKLARKLLNLNPNLFET